MDATLSKNKIDSRNNNTASQTYSINPFQAKSTFFCDTDT